MEEQMEGKIYAAILSMQSGLSKVERDVSDLKVADKAIKAEFDGIKEEMEIIGTQKVQREERSMARVIDMDSYRKASMELHDSMDSLKLSSEELNFEVRKGFEMLKFKIEEITLRGERTIQREFQSLREAIMDQWEE